MEVTQRRAAGGDWQGWSSTRRGTLTIAAIATLVAAGILIFAFNRYRNSVNLSSKPVNVLVATQLIEQGTSGDTVGVGHLFRTTKLLPKQMSTGAFVDPASLRGRVAATDIYPGQQLSAADFTTGGSIISQLAPSQRAVAVPLDSAHGLLGDISAGNHVDVYVSFAGHGATGTPFLRLLAPNVTVLKAGQAPSGGLGGSIGNQTSNVVLELNIHQAAELAFVGDNGKIWLTLRPGGGSPPGKETINEASIEAENPPVSTGGRK